MQDCDADGMCCRPYYSTYYNDIYIMMILLDFYAGRASTFVIVYACRGTLDGVIRMCLCG